MAVVLLLQVFELLLEVEVFFDQRFDALGLSMVVEPLLVVFLKDESRHFSSQKVLDVLRQLTSDHDLSRFAGTRPHLHDGLLDDIVPLLEFLLVMLTFLNEAHGFLEESSGSEHVYHYNRFRGISACFKLALAGDTLFLRGMLVFDHGRLINHNALVLHNSGVLATGCQLQIGNVSSLDLLKVFSQVHLHVYAQNVLGET